MFRPPHASARRPKDAPRVSILEGYRMSDAASNLVSRRTAGRGGCGGFGGRGRFSAYKLAPLCATLRPAREWDLRDQRAPSDDPLDQPHSTISVRSFRRFEE